VTTTEPTPDWASDYDIFDPRYVADPFPVWDDLRERCPVPHTERWGGSWMPTRYEDVSAVAHDTQHFSSSEVLVTPPPEPEEGEEQEMIIQLGGEVKAPPITSDPPEHQWARRLILPMFAPKAVARYEPITRELSRELVAELVAAGRGGAAVGYSQQIPVRIIAKMLGIPERMSSPGCSLRLVTSSKRYVMIALNDSWRICGSVAPSSRAPRTQPVNVSDMVSGMPSILAMMRTGICWL
jgi:cytochrome P450